MRAAYRQTEGRMLAEGVSWNSMQSGGRANTQALANVGEPSSPAAWQSTPYHTREAIALSCAYRGGVLGTMMPACITLTGQTMPPMVRCAALAYHRARVWCLRWSAPGVRPRRSAHVIVLIGIMDPAIGVPDDPDRGASVQLCEVLDGQECCRQGLPRHCAA